MQSQFEVWLEIAIIEATNSNSGTADEAAHIYTDWAREAMTLVDNIKFKNSSSQKNEDDDESGNDEDYEGDDEDQHREEVLARASENMTQEIKAFTCDPSF